MQKIARCCCRTGRRVAEDLEARPLVGEVGEVQTCGIARGAPRDLAEEAVGDRCTGSVVEPVTAAYGAAGQAGGNETFQVTTVLALRFTTRSALSFTPGSFASALKSTVRSSLITVVRV